MALQEEYEYSAFRCAFCNFFNPAKKLRPLPPKLQPDLASNVSFTLQRPSTSSSDSDSGKNLLINEQQKMKLRNSLYFRLR